MPELSLQSCLTLCDPMDCSPPGSSVHGILQARILAWVAMPSSGDLPDPGIESVSLCLLCWQVASLPLASPGDSHSKESACNAGDLSLIPGLGRSPGEGKGYPLWYSGLENSMVKSMGLQRVLHN